jgi:hypothetical protein
LIAAEEKYIDSIVIGKSARFVSSDRVKMSRTVRQPAPQKSIGQRQNEDDDDIGNDRRLALLLVTTSAFSARLVFAAPRRSFIPIILSVAAPAI